MNNAGDVCAGIIIVGQGAGMGFFSQMIQSAENVHLNLYIQSHRAEQIGWSVFFVNRSFERDELVIDGRLDRPFGRFLMQLE